MSIHKQCSIIKTKWRLSLMIQNIIMSAAMGIFLETRDRVRNSRGKRAISVKATEILLYLKLFLYSA